MPPDIGQRQQQGRSSFSELISIQILPHQIQPTDEILQIIEPYHHQRCQESYISQLQEQDLYDKEHSSSTFVVDKQSHFAHSYAHHTSASKPPNPHSQQLSQTMEKVPTSINQTPTDLHRTDKTAYTNFIKVFMQKPFRDLKQELPPDELKNATKQKLFGRVHSEKDLFSRLIKIKLYTKLWCTFYRMLVEYLNKVEKEERQTNQDKIRYYCDKIKKYSESIDTESYERAFIQVYNEVQGKWRHQYKTFMARLKKKRQPLETKPKQMTTRNQKDDKNR